MRYEEAVIKRGQQLEAKRMPSAGEKQIFNKSFFVVVKVKPSGSDAPYTHQCCKPAKNNSRERVASMKREKVVS